MKCQIVPVQAPVLWVDLLFSVFYRDFIVCLCLLIPVCSWPMTKLSSNSLPAHVLKGNSRSISEEGFQHTHSRSFLSGHPSKALFTMFISSKCGPPGGVAPAGNLCPNTIVHVFGTCCVPVVTLLGNKLLFSGFTKKKKIKNLKDAPRRCRKR